jgi:hypothetical protein
VVPGSGAESQARRAPKMEPERDAIIGRASAKGATDN